MLPDVVAPRGHQHLGSKGPRIFQVFFDPEEKSAISKKDQTELLGQSKIFFPIFRTNNGLHGNSDRSVVGLRSQRETMRALERRRGKVEGVSEVDRKRDRQGEASGQEKRAADQGIAQPERSR